MQKVTADNPYTAKYDLTNCDKEPIHLIQTVQSFACLLSVDMPSKVITQTSTNISDFFSYTPAQLLSQSLSTILSPMTISQLEEGYTTDTLEDLNPIMLPIQTGNLEELLLIAHKNQSGQLILEVEKNHPQDNEFSLINKLDNGIRRIQAAHKESNKLFDTLVREVKKITGYDRVMLYQFDESYNGQIIAEQKEDHLEPFLGLNYPSTDIPKQARDLFLENKVRIITDIHAQPSFIQPVVHPESGEPLHVGKCVARATSPVHLEYLEHMGVKATLNIAIVEDQKLWGLISCHHYTPKYISYKVRSMIRFMGQIISGHLSLFRSNNVLENILGKNKIQAQLFEYINKNKDLVSGLLHHDPSIHDYIHSDGVAVFFDEKIATIGKTPSHENLHQLSTWLNNHQKDILLDSDSLKVEYPETTKFMDDFAGLLSIKLSDNNSEYIVWFRYSKDKEIFWGGNPDKSMIRPEKEGLRLSPRKSFEKWKQVIKYTSPKFEKHEKDAAIALRNDIKEVIFMRFNELKKLYKKLDNSYKELESFSYSVSHDLRSPLRAIKGFSQILLEDYTAKLDDSGINVLNTIVNNTDKMNQFINEVLYLSQLANTKLLFNELKMKDVFSELVSEEIASNNLYKHIKIEIGEDTPSVFGDSVLLKQLFRNLISNSLKYSHKNKEAKVLIGGEEKENEVIFYVKDNGCGFDMKYADKIFNVFSRLVREEDYEGSGVGLSIVKRISERHNGRITFESERNKGTTFWVHFPKKKIQ